MLRASKSIADAKDSFSSASAEEAPGHASRSCERASTSGEGVTDRDGLDPDPYESPTMTEWVLVLGSRRDEHVELFTGNARTRPPPICSSSKQT